MSSVVVQQFPALGTDRRTPREEGIASLRYDKYFSGRTGGGSYAEDPGSFTVAAELRQADAAYGFLAARRQVDPSRLLVVGHSEGGMVALAVADSVAPKPAGLALLEPQDLRSLDVARVQADERIGTRVAERPAHRRAGTAGRGLDRGRDRRVPRRSSGLAATTGSSRPPSRRDCGGGPASSSPTAPGTPTSHLPRSGPWPAPGVGRHRRPGSPDTPRHRSSPVSPRPAGLRPGGRGDPAVGGALRGILRSSPTGITRHRRRRLSSGSRAAG